MCVPGGQGRKVSSNGPQAKRERRGGEKARNGAHPLQLRDRVAELERRRLRAAGRRRADASSDTCSSSTCSDALGALGAANGAAAADAPDAAAAHDLHEAVDRVKVLLD